MDGFERQPNANTRVYVTAHYNFCRKTALSSAFCACYFLIHFPRPRSCVIQPVEDADEVIARLRVTRIYFRRPASWRLHMHDDA